MDDNALELCKRADQRFAKRAQLDTFRQEIALNFAPWHASFTSELMWGEDFASHLIDGTPLLLARDFIGQIGAMLRPPGKQWFWHRSAHDSVNNDVTAREYLDWRSSQMMRIMTDRVTGFHRAAKQADEFFGFFGDAVMSVDTNDMQDQLRIRSWHVKDCVWAVGHENRVDTITRKELVSARVMRQRFGEDKLHEKVKEACEKNPDLEFEIRHEVLPADEYDYYKKGMKRKGGQYASIWIDVTNKKVLRESTTTTFRYVVPRWVTLPHMPNGLSPATTIALPDARLIQQQALAILEAAEKQINPPLIAYSDTIRGDVRLESRGITWVDKSYDERTGDPIRPLELGKNFQLGVESLMRTESQLTRAFFLDVLRMPDTRNSKSTLEVQFKIDEYVRAALPLFAPIQTEYNEALLYEVDKIIELSGGYDDREMPQILKKSELQYQWDNPLSDMVERQKVQQVSEISQLGQTIAALEAAAAQAPSLKQVNAVKMFRESAIAIGASAWLLTEDEAAEEGQAIAEQQQVQQAIAAAPNIAQVVDSGVNAAQATSQIPMQEGAAYPMLPA